MKPHLFLALALTVAACADAGLPDRPGAAPPPAAAGVPTPQEDTCGASPLGHLIGQNATALERELILRQMRILRPGQAMTMDYRADRINFEIDAGESITRIFCG